MLQTLSIRNFAIVENLTVSFGPGLNVITGETGAGKSILTGALGLLLGGRADKTLIRSGEETCTVEASFSLTDPDAINAVLEELGLTSCEDGALVLRRVLSTKDSGRALVNDSAITAQGLRRIGELLVDMHGPHDHQSLLSSAFQRDLLDAYGRHHSALDAYSVHYRTLMECRAAMSELEGTDDQRVAEQIDWLTHQIKEIEDAALTPGEDQTIEQEHAVVANAQRILELANGIQNGLTDDEQSAFQILASIQNPLHELAGLLPEAGTWHEEVISVTTQLQELSRTLASRVSKIEGDPVRLQWLEDRLALIHKLKRKFGGSLESVLAHLETSKEKLQALSSRGQRLAELKAEENRIQCLLQIAGKALGQKRRDTASKLARAITKELRPLGFNQGAFDVTLTETEPGAAGMDAVEFLFAPNPGEATRPLRAIASSGEISRVMLAVKSVLADVDGIPVLVFDEIDANVGGEVGTAVGAKLAVVAKHHQVLCITHLPQVAVQGAQHFAVRKEVKGGRTRTLIEPVEANDRVEEVARMLGGKDLTSVTLKHAKELLASHA